MTGPRALPSPNGNLVPVTRALVQRAVDGSRVSDRRRMMQPLHRTEDDELRRMLNAVQPDTYVRPHRHVTPPQSESWIVLAGGLTFFTFHEDGAPDDCVEVRAGSDVFGIDVLSGVYHALVVNEPDTVLYEVKAGPYVPSTDKAFAPWAPEEGSPEAPAYLESLRDEASRRRR